MPNLREVFSNDVTRGVAIGVGVLAAGWLLAPALRPVARSALKSGLLLVELGREKMAEAGEAFEDLVAEVRADLAEEKMMQENAAQATMAEQAVTQTPDA